MEKKKEFIISGPELKSDYFFSGSIAEYLIPSLKKLPKDFIIQIDAKTDEKITSYDFLKRCLEVSEGLIKLGLKKGDVVVLACPNSIRCLATALAVFFSNGILSPVDQNFKSLEIQHLFKQFQPKYIICESINAEKMLESAQKVDLNSKILLIDSDESNKKYLTWNDLKTKVDVDSYVPRKTDDPKKDVALISCSSGSTGLPKGVALSHYSVLYNNLILKSLNTVQLGSTMLLASPLFWISGIVFTLMNCGFGQRLIIPKSTKPDDLLESIEKYQPHFAMISPSSIMILVQHPNFHKYNLESLKCVAMGGAILGSAVAEKVKSIWKGLHIFQGYGMTEMAGSITASSVGGDLLSVGRLVPNTKMKVVDQTTGESLGPNQVGECRFKAERIMIGYYNNEEATKAAYDEDGWLKTGDLGYYNEDGSIYIVGRIKEIIKSKNYQISPTEIENFIMGLSGVADVAIIPIPKGMEFHLKAVVVKKPDASITAEDIIESVKNHKHLKAGVEFVDALPRSEVGKLKRWVLEQNSLH